MFLELALIFAGLTQIIAVTVLVVRLWRLPGTVEGVVAEEIRKQDDRIRMRAHRSAEPDSNGAEPRGLTGDDLVAGASVSHLLKKR